VERFRKILEMLKVPQISITGRGDKLGFRLNASVLYINKMARVGGFPIKNLDIMRLVVL
jgi:hypothetical protein